MDSNGNLNTGRKEKEREKKTNESRHFNHEVEDDPELTKKILEIDF